MPKNSENPTTFTASTLRNHITNEFRQSGASSALTAQLRAQLVQRLKKKNTTKRINNGVDGNSADGGNLSLEDRAIRSLIKDYLKSSNLPHSLAVFTPESMMDKNSVLSTADCLKAVGLNPLSRPYQEVSDGSTIPTSNGGNDVENDDPKPTLVQLINKMTSYVNATEISKSSRLQPLEIRESSRGANAISNADSNISSAPSDLPPAPESVAPGTNSLNKQLQMLHQKYEDAQQHSDDHPSSSVSASMQRFQRSCEEQCKRDLEKEIERFRSHELDMMRIEEQKRYRNELEGVRIEMKSYYDLRLEKSIEADKIARSRLKKRGDDIEQTNYKMRQEVLRELENVRRREIDNARALESKVRANEITEQRLKNKERHLETLEKELEKKKEENNFKCQKEFERAREEGLATYKSTLAKLNAQKDALEHESQSANKERLHYEKLRKDISEKHKNILSDDEQIGSVRLERDSLKIKLTEVMSKLSVYEDEYTGQETSDTWRDAKQNLLLALKQSEQEITDLKLVCENERETNKQLRMNERETFEKKTTLEAVAENLKKRLDVMTENYERASDERDDYYTKMTAAEKEVVELQILLKKSNAFIENKVQKAASSSSSSSKHEEREARLEKARQRAREQIMKDTDILKKEEEQEREARMNQELVEEKAKIERPRIVYLDGRPISVAWDPEIDGLAINSVDIPSINHQQPKAQQPAATDKSDIEKLEKRLEMMEKVKQTDQMSAMLQQQQLMFQQTVQQYFASIQQQQQRQPEHHHQPEHQHQHQHQHQPQRQRQHQQQQHQEPPVSSQLFQKPETITTTNTTGTNKNSHDDENDKVFRRSPSKNAADMSVEDFDEEQIEVALDVIEQSPIESTETMQPPTAKANAITNNKSWEQEYDDYLAEKDAEEKSALAAKQNKVSPSISSPKASPQQASSQEASSHSQAQQEALLKLEEAARQKNEREQKAAAMQKLEDAAKAERARKKKEKEDEEKRQWEEKERMRREAKRLEDEKRQKIEEERRLERLALEKAEKEKLEAIIQKQKLEANAATKLQSLGRRRLSTTRFQKLKAEKLESMSKLEKARLEREKKKAAEDAKQKAEEEAKRSETEKEHEEARSRAAERIRAREAERKEREEEEARQQLERRQSIASGTGTISDEMLEISDDLESFDSDDNGIGDDW